MKEAHETLYHFHKPETEAQANEWLLRYLVRTYNAQAHRSEPHSRIEDWLANLPAEGLRETLTRRIVLERVQDYFRLKKAGERTCGLK